MTTEQGRAPAPTTERSRRLFFALWPAPAVRESVAAATRAAAATAGGRTVPPANLHVTLAFLGAVDEGRVGAAVAAAARVPVVRGHLRFTRLVAWGPRGPLVLEPDRAGPAVLDLRAGLCAELEAEGFRLDRRAFRPHITLAREPARRLAPAAIPAIDWPFEDFALVESKTVAGGARYAVVAAFPGAAGPH